ncbi:MAG: sugar MFS transporter [Proteobacteria bacterium]|nr:sugar MFS transporter [Pseudomonadota bacterium]
MDDSATAAPSRPGRSLAILTLLFFMWGLITSLNDILVPHLKAMFSLSYVEASLVQFCFFGAYFVVSFPAGFVVERIGYQRGIVLGLVVAAFGCLLFYPASNLRQFPLFLGALFVLAAGITVLQVAANPLIAVLGPAETAPSRLTLTQAFNSLGTTIGPYLGALLILGAASGAQAVQGPYVGLAALLLVMAVAMQRVRLPAAAAANGAVEEDDAAAYDSIWQARHLVLGAVAIFLYVGGEVGIGSFLVNLMHQPDVAGLSTDAAGKFVSLYWGGAMVGRFLGSAVLARVPAGRVLAVNALVAAGLIVLAVALRGVVAMWALLAIGLFNSIMFPTIFTLSIKGLGARTGEGSGLLCMAIVGGALCPVAQGWVADQHGLLASFAIPLVCYLYIAYYGVRGSQRQRAAVARADA